MISDKISRYLRSYLYFGKKKIGFYANFGHGDLGDDAALSATKDILGRDIIPLSKKRYAFNPGMLNGLLIGSAATLRWEAPYIPRRILKKDKWDFPVLLFSAGINCDYGKEFSQESKDKIRKLCSTCDYLSVRDNISRKFLNDLGFKDVSIFPDTEIYLQEKECKGDFKKKNFTAGIVVTPHSEFSDDLFNKMIDVFSEFANYLIEKGNDVMFLRFERNSSDDKREKEIIKEILKRIKLKDRASVLGGDIEPEEMLFAIKNNCDAMVCTRLHSAVFAVNACIPFFCFTYNMMHDGFFDMIEYNDMSSSIFDGLSLEKLVNNFGNITQNYDSIKTRLSEKKGYLLDTINKESLVIKKILERSNR